MYNGIGLPTPRGSGTNGYVQRNLGALRHKRERADGRPEDELRKLEASLAKKPNRDILDHERKRKVELKCLELSELMEEQGYTESEIQEKVATFRMMLLEKDVALGKEGEQPDPNQKPTVTETHQLAEANEKKNERLRAAFGISDSYVDGSSFDPSRRAKEAPPEPPQPPSAVAAPVAAARESSSSPSPSPKQKKKKKKKDRGRSESRSGERKKAKKKKHRSESEAKKRKHRSPSPKAKHKSKEKKRKRSPSEAASQKSRRERSSSPAASSSSSASSRSRRSRRPPGSRQRSPSRRRP